MVGGVLFVNSAPMRASSPTLKDTYYHDSSMQLNRPDYANCIDLYDTDEKRDEDNKKVH